MRRRGHFRCLDTPLSRRELLFVAGGMMGLPGLKALGAGGDDAKIAPQDFPEDLPAYFICANTPTGGPFYKNAPATGDLRTKAAFDKDRAWPIGQELVIRFLAGKGKPNPWVELIKKKVADIAPLWSDYANLSFRFVDSGPCHLTLNFYPFADRLGSCTPYGLFNSLIGKDSINTEIRKTVPYSMNLLFDPISEYKLSADQLEAEFHRVILHEFGHAIGLIHEHQRPDAPIVWMDDIYPYAKENFGWDKSVVDEQIIALSRAPHLVGTRFDKDSIMMYRYPQGLAYYQKLDARGKPMFDANRGELPDYSRPFSSRPNTKLSALDMAAASVTYPTEMVLAGADPLTAARNPAPVAGVIDRLGQVVGYRFAAKPGDEVTVNLQGPSPTLVAIVKGSNKPSDRGAFANVLDAFETSRDGTGSFKTTLGDNDVAPGIYYIEVRANPPRARAKAEFKISVLT